MDHIDWGNAGSVRSAHSDLGSGVRSYVVLQDAEYNPAFWCNSSSSCSLPAQLAVGDLWPPPPPGSGAFLAWQYNNSACDTQGGAVKACAFAVPPTPTFAPPQGLTFAPLSPDRTPWAAYTVAPVLGNNYTLLGELGKLVALSPVRVRGVGVPQGGGGVGVQVTLAGAPGEVVKLAFVKPAMGGSGGPLSGEIATATVTLGADGTLTTTLV